MNQRLSLALAVGLLAVVTALGLQGKVPNIQIQTTTPIGTFINVGHISAGNIFINKEYIDLLKKLEKIEKK